jgi:hypothetical protein
MEFKLSWIDDNHHKISMINEGKVVDVAVLSCVEWKIVSLITGADITPWSNQEVSDVISATKVIKSLHDGYFFMLESKDTVGTVRVKTKLGFVFYLAQKPTVQGGYYLTTNEMNAVIKTRSNILMIASLIKNTQGLPLSTDSITDVHFIVCHKSIIEEELITRT